MNALPLAVTTDQATLVAAAIAAAATLTKLGVDILAARGAEARAAHRNVLAPHFAELGTAVHEVVSGAVLAHRLRKERRTIGRAAVQGPRGAEVIKRKRLELKYSLRGLEEPLRTPSRGYDWTATYDGHDAGDAFVEEFDREKALHRAGFSGV